MKKLTLGLVLAAVAVLGVPAAATAVDEGAVTNPFGHTNETINPHSKTN